MTSGGFFLTEWGIISWACSMIYSEVQVSLLSYMALLLFLFFFCFLFHPFSLEQGKGTDDDGNDEMSQDFT